jgi:hypothetical protein
MPLPRGGGGRPLLMTIAPRCPVRTGTDLQLSKRPPRIEPRRRNANAMTRRVAEAGIMRPMRIGLARRQRRTHRELAIIGHEYSTEEVIQTHRIHTAAS